MKYFLKCLYNFANFKGRARRKEFWYFVLYSGIIIALWNLAWIWFSNSISPKTVNQYLQEHIGVDALFVYPIVYVLLVFPFVMVISRRVNDTGIPFHVFMKRIWFIIGMLAIIAVLITKALSFFGNGDEIDFEALVVRFAIPILLVPFCYFFYCMVKKGTPGDNPYGPDPRIDDPIENARKIQRMDDGNLESHSSDNDFDPFAPKR